MFIVQCVHDAVSAHGLPISLFLAGLVGGVTHCAGMCGPFVLAQQSGGPALRKLGSALLLPYHFGRMTTYVLLAVVSAYVLNLAFVFSGMKALIAVPMLVLAGVIFLVSAFPALALLFPWASSVRWPFSGKLAARLSSSLMGNQSVAGRYALGVLLGFVPCGLVVSAILAAASAPSVAGTAIAMVAFAAGTVPMLVLVALGGGALRARFPNAVRLFSQGAMAFSGLWLFVLAGSMIF